MNRKPTLRVLLAVLLCAALPCLAGCPYTGAQRFTDTYLDVFDTAVTVTAYDESAAAFAAHSRAFHDALAAYHRLFDIYRAYDGVVNARSLNETAKNGPVRVDERLFGLLSFGKEVYDLTAGRVNICLGAVLALWHESREAGLADPAHAALPDEAALREAARHTDINDLVLDDAAKTVFFADPLLQIDLGAIAKGYAAGEAAAFAKETLWRSAVVSLGGNVVAFGKNPGQREGMWNVAVEDPAGGGDYPAVVRVADRSVVTSGDYQRFYTVNGTRYCHIIDPDTLFPAQRFSGVTVLCPDSARADALSTALFLLPETQGLALVEQTPDTEALWIRPDGSLLRSSGFAAFEKKK